MKLERFPYFYFVNNKDDSSKTFWLSDYYHMYLPIFMVLITSKWPHKIEFFLLPLNRILWHILQEFRGGFNDYVS